MVASLEDYDAESHREISFKQGEKIRLIFFHQNLEFWKGEVNGNIGYFPKKFVNYENLNFPVLKNPQILDQNNKKRREMKNHILYTEKEYLDDLRLITNVKKNISFVSFFLNALKK